MLGDIERLTFHSSLSSQVEVPRFPSIMPKELKKRGRRAEKQSKQQQDADEPENKRRKTEHNGEDFAVNGNAGDDYIGFGTNQQDDTDEQGNTFYGLLTEEEQEYYANVNNKISADDFEDVSDRASFIEAVHRETTGKEIKIASSQSCSRYLEKIIRLSTPNQLRSLFLAFLQDIDYLVQHRFGSHCTETLFQESAKHVEIKSKSDDEGSSSFEALFLEATEKLQANSGYLLTERFASHVIRVLLLVLAGKDPEGEAAKNMVASRKKEHIEIVQPDQIPTGSRKVPKSFSRTWRAFVKAALSSLDANYLRALATSPTGNPILQLLVQLELESEDDKDSKHEKLVLEKLIPDLEFDPESESSKFISSLVYDSTGAYLVQTLVKHLPGKGFKKMYRNLFRERIGKLAKNEIASYVAVSIFERVGKDDLLHAMEEVVPEIEGLVERNRLAVLRSLIERCAVRKVDLEPVKAALTKAYGEDSQNLLQKLLKLDDGQNSEQKEKTNGQKTSSLVDLQGSLLAQAMLRTKDLSGLIHLSLLAQEDSKLLAMSKISASSRVIQVALTADETPQSFLRPFVPKFYDGAADLAVDIAGSHVVDALWKATDGSHFMKERIAVNLAKNETKIRDTIYGRTVWRNWSMDIYQRRRGEWQAIAKGRQREGEPESSDTKPKKTPIELARERHLQNKARTANRPVRPTPTNTTVEQSV